MLPAFVIGLREGLETVVVLGAIVVFLRAQGRSDLLPRVWRAGALAAVLCMAIGVVIRYVEVNLPWRQQEQLETVVGLVAVATVTYMVVWMRRFPKDLRRDTDTAASAALARKAGSGLVLLAFFAVLREGFEVTVFLVATIGLTGRNAWLSTGGALLGVLAAFAIGTGVVKGTRHLDVARFFRVTAVVLVLSAAGIAMTSMQTANAAGWITVGQRPQFDLSWLAPPGSLLSSFTTGMFGLQPYPTLVEVVAWLAYLLPMMAVVLWPVGKAPFGPRRAASPRPRPKRFLAVGAAVFAGALGVTVALAVALPSSSSTTKTTSASAKILFAGLEAVTCSGASHCTAVGDFLPVDKDAAIGDPDGDGKATHTLVEFSDGARWVHVPSPDVGRGGSQLSSVSCPSVDSCTAVGFYRPDPFPGYAATAPPSDPLIESETDGRWHIVDSPVPAPDSVLAGVSCPTTSDCTAVGYAISGQSGATPLESLFIESFDGRAWTLEEVSPPPGSVSELDSVSCASTSACVAVGDSAPQSDPTATRPLVETMQHGTWRQGTFGSSGSGQGILYDVACPAVGQCLAAGNSVTGATGSALVLSLSGTSWTVDRAASSQAHDPSLTALGCAGVEHCVVAGTALESAAKVLAEVDDTGWQSLSPPAFSDNVDSIACPTQRSCVVVGSRYVNSLGNTRALTALLSAGTWTTEPNPGP